MAISAQLVRELRDKTGSPMMDCKRALQEADGSIEEAIQILRKKGMASAEKRSGRAAAEGLVACHIEDNGKLGVIVELNCETDFVAKNEEFGKFASDAAHAIAQAKPSGDDASDVKVPNQDNKTIGEITKEKIAKIGENIMLGRFKLLQASDGAIISHYIHLGGKIGVMVELSGGDSGDKAVEVAKNVAMHIAALSPKCITEKDVPEDVLAKEKEIYLDQAKQTGKPENVMEKIVEGRLKKFCKEICLVEQSYCKEPEISVKQYMEREGKEAGTTYGVNNFVRFQIGEGTDA